MCRLEPRQCDPFYENSKGYKTTTKGYTPDGSHGTWSVSRDWVKGRAACRGESNPMVCSGGFAYDNRDPSSRSEHTAGVNGHMKDVRLYHGFSNFLLPETMKIKSPESSPVNIPYHNSLRNAQESNPKEARWLITNNNNISVSKSR